MPAITNGGAESATGIRPKYPYLGHRASLVRLAALLTSMLGLIVLVGWTLDIGLLKSVLPGAVEMKVNTALGLVLSAVALVLFTARPAPWLQPVAPLLALAVAALGFATLGQYVFGWGLGIDELLFDDTADAYNVIRGRMSPYSAVTFAIIGLALAALTRPGLRSLVSLGGIIVSFIGVVSFVGYLWNASELITDRWLPPVAVNTAMAFILLGVGILLAGPAFKQEVATVPLVVHNSLEGKVFAAFVGALVMLLTAGGYTYLMGADFAASARRVTHTQEVRNALDEVYAVISNAESAQRSHLLTGDPLYKTEYVRFADSVFGHVRQLSQLVADNPVQMQHVAQLRPVIVKRLDALAAQIVVFEQEGFAAARTAVLVGDGIKSMESIRDPIEHIDSLEKKRLLLREETFEHNRERTLIALLLTLALVTLFFAALFRAIVRQARGREQASQQVREGASRLQAVLDNVVDGILAFDNKGLIESANPAAERIFGYTVAEMIGHNISMLMPEPYPSPHDTYIKNDQTSGEARIIGIGREVTGLRKDGSTFELELAISEFEAAGDQRYTGIMRDISARRKIEQALERESERLEMALNSAELVMWDSNLRSGKVILDRRWATLIEAEPGPCVTRAVDLLRLTPVAQRDELVEAASRITLGHSTRYRVEHQVATCNGEWRWIESHGQVVEWDAQGRPLRMIGINYDISERKQKEENLIAAKDEAQRASAAKDLFLATMSHEIRTPLNGLLGMLELLSLSSLDGEQFETLEFARDSGNSLVRIIDDVLDHAKIEAGKLEIRLQPVCIAQLLRRLLNMYQAQASAKNLLIKLVTDPHISPALLVDPLRMLQVLGNLVSNAIKFTSEGYVEIRATLIERSAGADTVRFSVRDTGIGIEPQAQQRLFQPFEQASTDTTRLYGGTGLGLAISRRLMEMMGGTLELESVQPGNGTTMNVTLSLRISEDPLVEYGSVSARLDTADPVFLDHAMPVPFADWPIALVVDDSKINLRVVARQFAMLGLQVQEATDGQLALDLWRAGEFALVVTDCNMPQMDGYTLARTIRAIEAEEGRPRTPIIAWTANVLSNVVEQCQAADMDDILSKPTALAQLKAVLSKYLTSDAELLAKQFDIGSVLADCTQAPPIDVAELNKIALDATEKAEILQDFLIQTRSDVIELEAVLKIQDGPATCRLVHRIKGASQVVGARELTQVCRIMEQAAQWGRIRDAVAEKPALHRALQRLETYVVDTVGQKKE